MSDILVYQQKITNGSRTELSIGFEENYIGDYDYIYKVPFNKDFMRLVAISNYGENSNHTEATDTQKILVRDLYRKGNNSTGSVLNDFSAEHGYRCFIINRDDFENIKKEQRDKIKHQRSQAELQIRKLEKQKRNKRIRPRLERLEEKKKNIDDYFSGNLKYFLFAGDPLEITYDTVKIKREGNCLVDTLKYLERIKSKNVVNKFFLGKEFTLETLKQFVIERKITTNLYDGIFGKLIYHYKSNNDHSTFNNLNAMIADNHIYLLEGTVHHTYRDRPPKPKGKKGNTKDIKINRLVSENCIYMTKEFDKMIKSRGYMLPVNFSYYGCDYKIIALNYNNENKEDEEENILSSKEDKIEIDMNKCFWNCLQNTNDEMEIGIFTGTDIIEKYESNMKIISYYYYFLDKAPEYFQSNLLHGFMVNYLLEEKKIDKQNIKHVKSASKKITVGKYKEMINKLRENLETKRKKKFNDKKFNKIFRVWNGIQGSSKIVLGQCRTFMRVLSEEEINFHKSHIPNLEVITKEGRTIMRIDNDDKFKYINNINYYNFVVDRANLKIISTIYEIEKLTNEKPFRIKTDALFYYNREKIEKLFNNKENIIKDFKIVNKHILKKQNSNMDCSFDSDYYYKTENEYNKEFINHIRGYKGGPGTGKTHMIKIIKKGYNYAMTITNVCARNLDFIDKEDPKNNIIADTIYSSLYLGDPKGYFRYNRKFEGKTSWIDEFSMIDSNVWSFIILMAEHSEIIITGDENQTKPIGEPNMPDKIFFKRIVEKLEELTERQRFDQEYFEFIKEYKNNKNLVLKAAYDKKGILTINNKNFTQYKTHFVLSHDMRKYINQEMIKKLNLTFDKKKEIYSVGLRIKPKRSSKKEKIYKGQIWEIKDIKEGNKIFPDNQKQVSSKDEIIILARYERNRVLNDKGELEIKVNTIEFPTKKKHIKSFDLGYAITATSCIGLTVWEDFCIHESQLMQELDRSQFYTALGRGTILKHLHICNFEPPEEFKKLRREKKKEKTYKVIE